MIYRGRANQESSGKNEDRPFESSWLISANFKFKMVFNFFGWLEKRR